MNKPQLTTKARTLEGLCHSLKSAKVLPVCWFTVGDWALDKQSVRQKVLSAFGDTEVIIRSSALSEDSTDSSMAGQFDSVLNVSLYRNFDSAVDRVIRSFECQADSLDEVLVQPMLNDVKISGVIMSHDPTTGAPYRVFNYVQGSDTTAVTGGHGDLKTFVLIKGLGERLIPQQLKPLLPLIDELETFFPEQPLDIEFAIDNTNNEVYLLQVRPLVVTRAQTQITELHNLAHQVHDHILHSQTPHPFLRGRSTVFGVMPDWNPAEIIGVRPRPLALSLYRELVTDAIWAYQRDNYGYKNLRSFPLLKNFFGQPYVDVRVSFNSFIPKDIEDSLADRLVDYYIQKLISAPTLHDKVEFEIVFSCYSLDLQEKLESLSDAGFSQSEQKQLADSLRNLTNRVIDGKSGLWRTDLEKLTTLQNRRELVTNSSMDTVSRIYWLLEDCKRYGTLPFAGLARAGFIAVQMLKSLVSVGVLTTENADNFLNSLNTVSSQLARDKALMSKQDFLEQYGHLRPGTYDILSPRYDEAPEKYFKWSETEAEKKQSDGTFHLSLDQMRDIARLLEKHGLSSNVVDLFEFLQTAIESREYSKFLFSKNLSDAISLFRRLGESVDISPEDMSYCNIRCIYELYSSIRDIKSTLLRSIDEGKILYAETSKLWMPPLITSPQDVFGFAVPESEPNFVTQGRVTGMVVTPKDRDQLKDAIVFIPNADPGYDWLFSHSIAGLVTAYGGVNSHMAIRANEMGLPAVIGAGEALFYRWATAKRLHIDCAGRRVEILA